MGVKNLFNSKVIHFERIVTLIDTDNTRQRKHK